MSEFPQAVLRLKAGCDAAAMIGEYVHVPGWPSPNQPDPSEFRRELGEKDVLRAGNRAIRNGVRGASQVARLIENAAFLNLPLADLIEALDNP